MVIVLVLGVGALGGAYLFGNLTTRTSAQTVAEPAAATVTVTEQTVGETLEAGGLARRTFTPVGSNQLAGTATSVASADNDFNQGDTLYSVNAIPVLAVAGDYPFYRDLAETMEGPDVVQLRRLLGDLGFYGGRAEGPFTPTLARAVRSWQKAHEQPETGVVRLGELLAVGDLPATLRLSLNDQPLRPGQLLAEGDVVVSRAESTPTFTATLTDAQAARLPEGASATVSVSDRTFPAVVRETVTTDSGDVALVLEGPDGAAVCQDSCGELPADIELPLSITFLLTAETTGPAVPTAALQQDEVGTTFVATAGGERVAVDVIAQAGGVAVLSGVSTGTVVELP